MRRIAPRLLAAVVLVVISLLAVAGSLSGPPHWSPDGLFYQARVYELRDGLAQPEALRKAFGGPLGADLRAVDPDRSGSPQWVAYNARFYERRALVPWLAAQVTPLSGDRALLDVSLAGHVAAVLAIFWLLLALGLRLPAATAAAAATAFVPALTLHAGLPLTDTWGLALEAAALAVAVTALRRRDLRLVAPWALVLLALAFTRDSAWVPVLAAAALALAVRTRLAAVLAGTGFLAAALPALLVPVPMRELLAQMLHGAMPAPDASWGDVLSRYPGAVADLLQADGGFVRDGAWVTAAFLLGGLVALAVLGRARLDREPWMLMVAAALAGAAYVLAVPVFSGFRIELVLVPMAATGVALAAEALLGRVTAASRVRSLPAGRRSRPLSGARWADLGSDRP